MEYGYHRENTGKRQQFFKIPNETPNKKQIRIKSLLRVSPIEDLIFKYDLKEIKVPQHIVTKKVAHVIEFNLQQTLFSAVSTYTPLRAQTRVSLPHCLGGTTLIIVTSSQGGPSSYDFLTTGLTMRLCWG